MRFWKTGPLCDQLILVLGLSRGAEQSSLAVIDRVEMDLSDFRYRYSFVGSLQPIWYEKRVRGRIDYLSTLFFIVGTHPRPSNGSQ